MTKVDVIKIEKRCSLVSFEELSKYIKGSLKRNVLKISVKGNIMEIFLKESFSFSTIDKLLFEKIEVKEFTWRYKKGVNGGTTFLNIKIP